MVFLVILDKVNLAKQQKDHWGLQDTTDTQCEATASYWGLLRKRMYDP